MAKWPINELERKRTTFESDDFVRPSPTRIKEWNDTLKEEFSSLSARSSGRRSVLRRARDVMRNVLHDVGPEVLLLLVTAVRIAKRATLDCKTLVPQLRTWWASASHTRRSEELDGFKGTNAVRLYLAHELGVDFRLEVKIDTLYAKPVSENARSMEDWEAILGTFLYAGMKASRSRKVEEELGLKLTGAARISFPEDGAHDSKLNVMLDFDTGYKA
ncbi:unnamed protein product [Alternaria alternata]